MTRPPLLLSLGLLSAGLGGCVGQTALAQRVRAAAQPSRMPAVVACWERAFETAGFRGSYLATVDFVVEPDGALRDVAVTSFVDRTSGEDVPAGSHADDLRRCVHDALTQTRLASIELDGSLVVSGYRLSFDDGSEQAREAASERAPHLLIGPRADRCTGLYGHEPPRDVATLQGELEHARGEVERAGDADRDRRARGLQHQYDVALELAERLRLASEEPGLSREARQRYLAELHRARKTAVEVGAAISCRPPASARFR